MRLWKWCINIIIIENIVASENMVNKAQINQLVQVKAMK